MTDLRPAVLDDYGLVAAIRWCGEQAARRTGMKIVVEGEGFTPRLPVNTETILFWVVQEAVMNVTKHAQATQITITIEADNESVRLTVMDDGAGFNPAHLPAPGESGGWGLPTMRERVETLGGSFRIESTPGEGTRIIAEVKR